jgi:hypothetical protein
MLKVRGIIPERCVSSTFRFIRGIIACTGNLTGSGRHLGHFGL